MVTDKRIKYLAKSNVIADITVEEIHAFCKEILQRRQLQTWIPVDEIPPDDTMLFVVKTVFDKVYAIQMWDSNDKTWIGDDYSYDANEVTHYMPLPPV